MRWVNIHKHNVHIVLLVLRGRQHRSCGNKGNHTRPLQRGPVGTDTSAGRVCLCALMSADKLWVASLLILAASQRDGERPATVPSARPPSDHRAAFVLTKYDCPSHAGANPRRLQLWRPPGSSDASRHRNSTPVKWFSRSAEAGI